MKVASAARNLKDNKAWPIVKKSWYLSNKETYSLRFINKKYENKTITFVKSGNWRGRGKESALLHDIRDQEEK
jgi:hypothetical protein